MSGTRDGLEWPPFGSDIDLPADEAAHLVAAGLAVERKAEPRVESAAVDTRPARRAAKPSTRSK